MSCPRSSLVIGCPPFPSPIANEAWKYVRLIEVPLCRRSAVTDALVKSHSRFTTSNPPVNLAKNRSLQVHRMDSYPPESGALQPELSGELCFVEGGECVFVRAVEGWQPVVELTVLNNEFFRIWDWRCLLGNASCLCCQDDREDCEQMPHEGLHGGVGA